MKKGYTTAQFIEKATKVHSGKYTYGKCTYTTYEGFVTITCPIHGDVDVMAYRHLLGRMCPECGKKAKGDIRRLTIDDVKDRLREKYSDTIDLSLFIEYENRDEKYPFKCLKHSTIFHQSISKMLSPTRRPGCSVCIFEARSKTRSLGTEKFIKRAKERFGDLYSYAHTVYVQHDVEVVLTCSEHGDFYVEPDAHLHARKGCPTCTSRWSKGEQAVASLLSLVGISFKQDRAIGPGKRRYDFILEKEQVLIEYDGIQHFRPIIFAENMTSGRADEAFEGVRERDIIKNRVAIENGYALYRIPYFVSLEDACQLIIREVFSVTAHDECEPGRGVLKVFLPPNGDGETLYEVFTEVPELEEPALAAD